MAEDRVTRLSRQLAKKVRRECPELQLSVSGDNVAFIERTRFRSESDEAFALTIPRPGDRPLVFFSKTPASDLLKGHIRAEYISQEDRHRLTLVT